MLAGLAFQNQLGSDDSAVIAALLHHGDTERALAPAGIAIGDQGIVADAFANSGFVQGLDIDQALGIAATTFRGGRLIGLGPAVISIDTKKARACRT
jgi:hypothetical protein